jgi:uncharacterized protein YjbI with pentapeptide repeats
MADEEQLKILRQGVAPWNAWREKNPGAKVFLRGAYLFGERLEGANLREAILFQAHLSGAHLNGADLSAAQLGGANLAGARLTRARLVEADASGADLSAAFLNEADLRGARLTGANLWNAHLSRAKLNGAILSLANLNSADLTRANLDGAELIGAQLTGTDLCNAILIGNRVYGVSAWDIKVNDRTIQQNLIITRSNEPVITVDDLEVAQFIYLLLNNQAIRKVIDTITSKAVLILGRFSPERKIILDRLREELRTRHYVPIMFDFEPAKSRDTIETIRILAGMVKFIIADLTEAKAVVQELQAIVPNLPSVAVRLLIRKSEREPGMFDHIRRFPWVLPEAFEYENAEDVIASIRENIIAPAEAKVEELRRLIRPAAR